jgi:hypothetical protein
MPNVSVDIRKALGDASGTPAPPGNPWTWQYEQDGRFEESFIGLSTALAAYNAARTRYVAENFSSQVKYIRILFTSTTDTGYIVEAEFRKTDDANPWNYTYTQNGHRKTVVIGIDTAANALNDVRDRYLAETFAVGTIRIKLFLATEEPSN